nr:transposase (putative), gypsy type [Tanacetum cinerariifolium]
MSTITDIRCVLTQKAHDSFCDTFHIPDEVHPVLPNPTNTIHERPAGKIGLYTRFFDFANFRLPLSTFFVDILRHFRINISQLSVIDEFACPASFPWHTAKHVVRDPFPATSDFNAEDYATFVAHPSPFRKFSEPFICLVGLSRHYTLDEDTYPRFVDRDGGDMNLFAFIHVPDPTKVRVVERERAEGEPRVLETTVGHTVLLLPIAPDRADSDLEASVNRLFDEGGSCAGGEQEAGTAARVRIMSGEDVAVEEPRRLWKKRQAATDAGGSSYPPKKLRSDYIAPNVAPSAGKSPSGLRDLLAKSMLNVESGAEAATTLPFVTSFVSATPEHDSGVPTAPERFVISSDSSHYSSNASEAEGSSIIRFAVIPPMVTEAVITTQVASIPSTATPEPSTKVVTPVHDSMFQDSNSAGTVRPDVAGSSHAPRKELSLGSREVNSESLHEVFVPQWSILNNSLLDSLDASREFIDHLAPQVLFAQIRDMDYEELFIEFSVGIAQQACLSAELRMRPEFCLSERRRLESQLGKQADLLKSKDEEVEDLNARILLKKAEAAEAIHLPAEASNFEAVEKSLRDEDIALKGRNTILEKEQDALDGKVTDLAAFVTGKERELTTLDAQLTVHKLEVASSGFQEKLSNYENLTERLKEFQDAQLKVVNDNFEKFAEGRTLADVAAYNPSVEADYVSALQRLQNINFSLLAELRSSKDASIDTIMNILRLENNLGERVVVGATSLSFALDVSDARVWKIRENIASQRPTLRDVFIPISEPFSAEVLTGTRGTFDTVSAPITTALSTTLAFANTVAPITVDDNGVVGTDDRAGADADPFPNVDDAELNMP